jgi:hypothetical protein
MKGEKVGIAFSWYNLQKVENVVRVYLKATALN